MFGRVLVVLGVCLWIASSCRPGSVGSDGRTPSEPIQDRIVDSSGPGEHRDSSMSKERPVSTDRKPELPPEPPSFACTMPTVPAPKIDATADKFALTMFHYNLEYVVGGLSGGGKFRSFCGETCDDWDNDRVEDWIIRESFAPVVDFYLQHPDWKVNFEMQGYMLEVIAKRFPKLLEKLRTLTGRGQMEISSFHYSDQLFLAFPRADLARSVALTKAIFKRYCIPLSGVVFNQEGQAGEGRQKFLVQHGYTIGVFPKNLFKYVRGDQAVPWPYYKQFGGYMIVGPMGVDPASKIKVAWSFFDDGELLAVKKKLNPYFAPAAQYDPTRMKEYENAIKALVAQGYKIVSISDYVAHLKARKLEAKPAPKLLDGTWQPKSTSSIHRWLGGKGIFPQERDNEVRAGNYRARTRLRAAELLYLHWKKQHNADPWIQYRLDVLWRRMLRAQVSDATGVNPWAGEIQWALDLNAEVLKGADAILKELKARLKTPFVEIQLQDGAVKLLKEQPKTPSYPTTTMPLKGFEVVAKGRTAKVTVWKLDDKGDHLRVQIAWSAGSDPKTHRSLMVRFPRLEERIIYSPGLMDDEIVDYPLSDFTFQTKEVYLPLSNGLIGLGKSWYVIKHVRTNHLAARVSSDQQVIEFIDHTQPYDQAVTWVFDLFKGERDAALKAALSLNIFPTVVY